MKMVRELAEDAVVVDTLPHYYPRWMRWVVLVPGLREVATWNLLLVMRRRSDGSPSAASGPEAGRSRH